MTSEKFISQQSFALRTQLTHIYGALKLLAHRMKAELSPADAKLLNMALRHSEALLSQIEAIEKMRSPSRLKLRDNVTNPGAFFAFGSVAEDKIDCPIHPNTQHARLRRAFTFIGG